MNMTEIYEQASGVDLEQQKRLWDERGKGYYGEFLVFQEIFPLCSNRAKILTNVHIPYEGRTTEIDVLLIDTFGIISFEVKHYKGAIYGKSEDQNWTQAFRTTKNNSFHSPILQNDYHTAALHSQFPSVPIYSFVVFTSQDVKLLIQNHRPDVTVCHLYELKNIFPKPQFHQEILDDQSIDHIFTTCSEWAPKKDNFVAYEGKELPLSEYAQVVAKKAEEEAKNEWQKRKSPLSIVLVVAGAASLLAAAVLLLVSLSTARKAGQDIHVAEASVQAALDAADQRVCEAEASVSEIRSELAEMDKILDKYHSTASWNNDGNLDIKEDFIEILDFSMEPSPDLEKGTRLSFTVKCNGTDFGVHINGSNELVMLLKDGRSVSGKLTDFTTNYIDSRIKGGKSYSIPQLLIAGVDPSEIKYIKLTGSQIVKAPETYMTVVNCYEFLIYKE